MANILGNLTINDNSLYEVDGDPSAGAGTPAALSSLAMRSDVGQVWLKTSAPDTGWSQIAFDNTTFTPGSVIFAGASGGLSEDNANIFFDDTNNRLGIGTSSPTQSIDTTGNARIRFLSTTGIVHNDANGVLSTSLISLTTDVTGVLPIANGGTNAITFNQGPVYYNGTSLVSVALTNGQLLIGSTGANPVAATLTAGTGISITNGAGSITVNNTGVTSVALAAPSIFTVSGSPVTTTGTLTLTLANQTANTIFAGPASGGAAAPTFRTQVLADLPQLTNGQLYIGSTGASVVAANLTQGANQGVTITNGAGSIQLATVQDIRTSASPTFAGLTISTFTLGSVIFAGTGGLLSQDNASFFFDDTNNRLGLLTTTPARTLDVNGSSFFRGAIRYADAGAALANYETIQAQVQTTDATVTTLASVATITDTTMLLTARVTARRTGGTAGTAGDSAAYIRTGRIKNIGGTLTLLNLQTDYTSEDQNGWNAIIDVSGTNARVRINGAANNNVDWTVTYFVQTIS